MIKVRRKKCHGDFCGYKEAGDTGESEFDRPQSSSSSEPSKYVQWKAANAIQTQLSKTNEAVKEFREEKKQRILAEVKENISVAHMKRNLTDLSHSVSIRPSSAGSTNTPNAASASYKKEKCFPIAFRLIANARTEMKYMSDDLAKWYLCDRAKRRRGDGPWLYVTSPNVSSAYKVPQTARCILGMGRKYLMCKNTIIRRF